jgi:hypothetical protein
VILLISLFAFIEPAQEWGMGVLGWGIGSPIVTETSPSPADTSASPAEASISPAEASPRPAGYTLSHTPGYRGAVPSERFEIIYTADFTPADGAMEILYTDYYFTYWVLQNFSEYLFIAFSDGSIMPLVEALNSGRVAIEDCVANGLRVSAQLSMTSVNYMLGLGFDHNFFLNNNLFFPSMYFMLHGGGIELYYLFELRDFLMRAGLNEEAYWLLDYAMRNGEEMLVIAGRPYISMTALQDLGIYVDTTRFTRGRYYPTHVRFRADDGIVRFEPNDGVNSSDIELGPPVTDENGFVWIVEPQFDYEKLTYCWCGSFLNKTVIWDEVLDPRTGRVIRQTDCSHCFTRVIWLYDPELGLLGNYIGNMDYNNLNLYPKSDFPAHFPDDARSFQPFILIDSTKIITHYREDGNISRRDFSEAYLSDKFAVAYAGEFITNFTYDEEDIDQWIIRNEGFILRNADYIALNHNGGWGFLDSSGGTAVPFVFDNIVTIDGKTAFVSFNGLYGILDIPATVSNLSE